MSVKYRLRFTKLGSIRFIGHLDLMRVFRLAVNRSGLPVSYSQGFNPHQKLSFALPLPLGMGSVGEYADLELDTAMESSDMIAAMNACLPEGMAVTGVRMLEQAEKSAASLVRYGEYDIDLTLCAPEDTGMDMSCGAQLLRLMELDELYEDVRTKSGTKKTNIRPYIYSMRETAPLRVNIIIAAGSGANLKPDIPAKLICESLGLEYDGYKTMFIRKNLFKENLVEL